MRPRAHLREKNRADPRNSRSLFVAFAKIVTTLSPSNGDALIRHSKDNSIRGWPNSAESKAVSPEKLEAGGIRSSPLRPKANAFLAAGWPAGEVGYGIHISGKN